MRTLIRLADLIVEADYRYEYLNSQLADYKISGDYCPDISVCVTEEDILAERGKDCVMTFPDAYLESLAFYRKFASCAASMGCILFHGSALSVDGEGYLFGAPSGTGKSTHARLYRELFGDRVVMVNDDKPFLRKKDDQFVIFGTPWDGKHHLSNNISVPLRGICFLKQGSENTIRKINVQEAMSLAFNQIYRPEAVDDMRAVLALTQALILNIPMYELTCTISYDAVRLSYETMKGAYLQ